MKLLLGILLLGVIACTTEVEIPKDQLQFISSDEFCLSPKASSKGYPYIIQSQGEYDKNLGANTLNEACQKKNFARIDYDKYSLLGNSYSGSGCSGEYDVKVYRDDKKKSMLFESNFVTSGNCKMIINKAIWVAVPEFPSDYTVKFE